MWDSCASAHNAASGNGDPTRRNRRQIIQRQSTFYLFPRETESNQRSIFFKKEHPAACEIQKCPDDRSSASPSSPLFKMSRDMQRKLGKRRFISEKKERDGFRSIRRPNRQIVPWRSKTALVRRNFPPVRFFLTTLESNPVRIVTLVSRIIKIKNYARLSFRNCRDCNRMKYQTQ